MLEDVFIKHCAPTISGIKMANMVSIHSEEPDIWDQISGWNRKLTEQHLHIEVLKQTKKNLLLYLYDKVWLTKKLREKHTEDFLLQFGYATDNYMMALNHLKGRFASVNFPHEVGIFLDYPTDDVIGFIDNKGKNFIFCGSWKVYHNPSRAKKLFAKYKNSTKQCEKMYHNGADLFEISKLLKGVTK